ncbi:MAG: amidohydrolase family protein [Helicobacteraceae bacterium]|jgi:dihydroorotase|nr:amidohydrolase family protein [Helicobacteraceae bacterium]
MKIVLRSPFDAHLHLRDGELLTRAAALASRQFAGAIAMPNLAPPLTTPEMCADYKSRVESLAAEPFAAFPALFLTDKTPLSPPDFNVFKPLAVKLYPAAATTNSENGVNIGAENLARFGDFFEMCAANGVALSIHGETNGAALEREAEFAPIYAALARAHPNLKVIMEHISTRVLADLLDRHANLYATITLHHLLYTIDDLIGGALKPHLFCKPVVKTAADRAALRELAFAAREKVMFGSDSAPHLRSAKEGSRCAAGIFSAPVLLPKLAELFAENAAISKLQKFVGDNARKIYDFRLPDREITLIDEPFTAPNEIAGIVPMCAEENIAFSIMK